MNYTSTVTHGLREEIAVDVERWAADLAEKIGGTVIPPEHRNLDQAEIALPDDLRLGVYWTRYKTPKQIQVRGSHARVNELNRRHRPSGLSFPEAHVAVERDMGAIAKDVTRRVIEPSRIAGLKLVDAIAERTRALGRLSRRADDLRTIFPLLQVKINNDGDEASLYLNAEGAEVPFFSGRLYSDGNVYVERVGSMNAVRFDRVMRALTEDLS